MPRHPASLASLTAPVAVVAGLAVGVAQAAVPLTLPPGELAADWESAARLAGFSLSASLEGPGVRFVAFAGSWEIRVRDASGSERRVPVPAPRTPREREDLLWVAASLAVPLASEAPTVPMPAAPVPPPVTPPPVTPSPVPRAPASAPTKAAPTKAAPTKAAPEEVAPAPQPVAPPVAPPVETAAPPEIVENEPVTGVTTAAALPAPAAPEAPADARLPSPVRPRSLTPLVMLSGGLGASGSTAPDDLGSVEARASLAAGAEIDARWTVLLELAGQTPTSLGALGDTERVSRQELAAEAGLSLGGTWDPWARGRLGISRLRFSAGEPATLSGSLQVPALGLRVGVERDLRAGLSGVLSLGLDHDLREVVIVKEDTAVSLDLPSTRALLELGLRWSP